MTAVAPRPVVTRPYPVQRAPRGAKFLQYLHTTDPKVLGVMYIALMVASVVVAFYLLHTGSTLAWAAAGLLAAATLIGFVLSRTTGLPNVSDDIGNWTEPLGLASMFVEGAVVILAAYAWSLARHERRPGVHASVAPRVSAGR